MKPRPGKKYVLLEEAAVQSARYRWRWRSPRDAVAVSWVGVGFDCVGLSVIGGA